MLAPAIASLIFTLAGTGTTGTVRDGELAVRTNLPPSASVAPLEDGTFLVGSGDVVSRVDAQGTIRTVARGAHVSGLAALPGGDFLIADGAKGRVQMVDASGRMTTVAGGGTSRGDGLPATQVRLGHLTSVAAAPGGGFVIGDGGLVLRVGPDGLIRTIAGYAETQDEPPPATPRPTEIALNVYDVALTPGGDVLIADLYANRVLRVSPAGEMTVAATDVTAYGVGALPDGGFLVADNLDGTAVGVGPHIWRYAPDGSRTPLAGSGRFVELPPTGFERRGDGASALDADLDAVLDAEPAPDGGVLFTEGLGSFFSDNLGGLVRYIPPAQPGILAVAILRDRDRVFTPGKPSRISVTTTLPATLSVSGRSVAVPAGTTRVPLPALSAHPHAITVVATDAAGRRAADRARVFPRGYLPEETARAVAAGTAFRALRAPALEGDGVLSCRRLGPRRVDCAMASAGSRCELTTAISFVAGRVRWGTYACGYASHPRYRRRPRPVHPRDWACVQTGASCPAPVFGKVRAAALLPSS